MYSYLGDTSLELATQIRLLKLLDLCWTSRVTQERNGYSDNPIRCSRRERVSINPKSVMLYGLN